MVIHPSCDGKVKKQSLCCSLTLSAHKVPHKSHTNQNHASKLGAEGSGVHYSGRIMHASPYRCGRANRTSDWVATAGAHLDVPADAAARTQTIESRICMRPLAAQALRGRGVRFAGR